MQKNRGVTLKAHWNDEHENYPNSLNGQANYIKSGLKKNSPVAYMQLWNRKLPDIDQHWMTITKYYRGALDDTEQQRWVALSTWGERRSINFYSIYNDGSTTIKGYIYFDW